MERQDLAAGLTCFPWTCELKDGRVPHVTLSEPNGPHKLGFWKSEEFSKFAIVASYVLRGRIPKSAYKCFTLLTKIHHLIFSKQLRINGWTKDHIELLECLLWKHAIQYESICGISPCTENVEYSLHMAEDVRWHNDWNSKTN